MKFFPAKKKEEKKDEQPDASTAKNVDETQIPTSDAKKHSSSSNLTSQQVTLQTKDDILGNDEVRKVIDVITTSKDNSIIPTINFEENHLYYPSLEQLGTHEYIVTLLEKLSSPSVNILEKGVYERLTVCPQHPQYLTTTPRLYCSSCLSTDITKLHLIEHKLCGYITEKRDLGAESDEIQKCMSCKSIIKDPQKEIRKLGRWYECNSCKVKFDNCIVKLHCRKFDHDFEINQASMIVIPSYQLKSDYKSLFVYAFSIIPQIKKVLESYGFIVEESQTVKGKSGIEHKISIYAHNHENKTIAIDIKGSENVIEDTEVNSMIVKVLDIYPTVSIFIGIPSVSDTAKAMAAAHNIALVTGKNFAEMISTVEQLIKTRLNLISELGKN